MEKIVLLLILVANDGDVIELGQQDAKLSGSVRTIGQMQSNDRRAKNDTRANEKSGTQAFVLCDPPERRASNGHRDIEEDRIDTHR